MFTSEEYVGLQFEAFRLKMNLFRHMPSLYQRRQRKKLPIMWDEDIFPEYLIHSTARLTYSHLNIGHTRSTHLLKVGDTVGAPLDSQLSN